MDRTLYLTEKHGVEIRRDGPSVWIREKGKAGHRVPARLVDRVVVIGNIRMDAGLISLFTEENIPVTFFDRRGRELAVCIPYNHRLPRHHEEQKVLFRTEGHACLFKQWLLAARRSDQLETISRLAPDKAWLFSHMGFRERDYEAVIKANRTDNEDRWHAARTVVEGLMHEMLIRSLLRADLDPHLGITGKRHNFALVLDFTWALCGETDLQTLRLLKAALRRDSSDGSWFAPGGAVITKDGIKAAIAGFENRKQALHNLIEAMIDDLFRLIREVGLGVYDQERAP